VPLPTYRNRNRRAVGDGLEARGRPLCVGRTCCTLRFWFANRMCRCAGSGRRVLGPSGKLFLPDGKGVFGVLVGFVLSQHVPSWESAPKTAGLQGLNARAKAILRWSFRHAMTPGGGLRSAATNRHLNAAVLHHRRGGLAEPSTRISRRKSLQFRGRCALARKAS
jgi:hypothetical protein